MEVAIILNLKPIANQSIVFDRNGIRFELSIKESTDAMFADISKNDAVIASGVRLVAGFPVIPFPHLAKDGNFYLDTENDEIPDWRKFGKTQELYFYD